jgi:hypothetical protein
MIQKKGEKRGETKRRVVLKKRKENRGETEEAI